MRLIDIEDFYNRDKYEVLIITKGEGRTVARMLDFPEIKAYTKADMVAMLTEIQLEIEKSENCGKAFHLGLQMASKIIQQKINALKAESEDKE